MSRKRVRTRVRCRTGIRHAFTTDQFFEVFARYNHAIWPAQIAAYVLAAIALLAVFMGRPWRGRVVAAVLALFWLWNGVAYHLAFFAAINPAAYAFAAMFILQGLLFLVYGIIGDRFALAQGIGWKGIVGLVLIVYAMIVYGLLGHISGHAWPRAPVFGVAPCPTTIFTFGLLLLTTRTTPLWLLVVPLAWAAIGSTAAVLLAVREDLGLLVAALAALALLPRWGGRHLPAGA
ncbi:MAG: hypothetical protein F9K29_18370 [Hyphomicrobiaceae bacterium]|nr:MAG: hypothetical protein F9K29_18370 [Hyphomicrobiaceae bacterium]